MLHRLLYDLLQERLGLLRGLQYFLNEKRPVLSLSSSPHKQRQYFVQFRTAASVTHFHNVDFRTLQLTLQLVVPV